MTEPKAPAAPAPTSHTFRSHLRWTGAALGPTGRDVTYSREQTVSFDGKPDIVASSAPAYGGDPALHDPENLMMASLSTCHALTYLAVCAHSGLSVIAYEDSATGVLARVERVTRFTEVTLRPKVTVAAGTDVERARALHDKAHANCFMSSSVNFPVKYEPEIVVAG